MKRKKEKGRQNPKRLFLGEKELVNRKRNGDDEKGRMGLSLTTTGPKAVHAGEWGQLHLDDNSKDTAFCFFLLSFFFG